VTDYQAMADRVSRLSISESSPDGAITVTVSANGVLTGLSFTPEPELADEIMECVRRAQARIPNLLREAIFDTIGGQDPATHLLLDEARRRFPSPDPAPEQRKPSDDWSERDVMEDV
jgi:hypothetical protein